MANNANNPTSLVLTINSIATGDSYPLAYMQKSFMVTAVRLINQVALAASNTDYVTTILKFATTTVATLDTRAANQGALVANTAKSFGALQATVIPEGSVLFLAHTEAGSATLGNAIVQVDGYWL